MAFLRILAFLWVGGALSGCSSGNKDSLYSEKAVGVSRVSIKKGDNLAKIAARYGVSLKDLADENGLKPPYKIIPGQFLRLPASNMHVVRAGETLRSIAQKYNIDVYQIVEINQLKPPYAIYVGQSLLLKERIATRPSDQKQSPESTPLDLREKEPSIKRIAIVSRADKIPVTKLEKKIGKESVPLKKEEIGQKETEVQEVISAPKGKLEFEVKKLNSAQEKGLKNPPSFSWPVAGKVVASYGDMKEGIKNEGLNIQAAAGSPIKAAAPGTVVYCGDSLKEYGNLILIRHTRGWVTAYAYCDAIIVQKGQKVKQGDKIGTIGATGNVSIPQLYFEIRKKTRTVDPIRYLK